MSSKATEIAKNLPALEHPDGSPIRALVVDDEEMLKELVSMGLKMIGWEVQSAGDGPAALAIARDWRPDVLVLDIMMPGFDGLELLSRIRKFYPEVPCLFLTAKDSVDNRIEGLAAGADDYVTKPFKSKELLARVSTRLRRTNPGAAEHVRAGDLDIDVAGHQVKRGESVISLTPLEFELLVTLARSPWKVFTREELLSQVWGYQHPADTRLVNVHVQRLRAKIEKDPERPSIVVTVRGVGYRVGESA